MSQAIPPQQEFGKIRGLLWPIHAYELKKLIPMLIMAFFISFNYTVLRDTKDALIVTSAAAEAIPFLKLGGVVPAALLFMIIYSKMSNSLSRENLFYATLTPFLVFFALFSLWIYPNREWLHPTTSADYLQSLLPAGWAGLVGCYRNWSYALFYIMSELWGSAVLSLMFWGFANQITRMSEAKRFYSLFGLGFNLALPIAGTLIILFSDIRRVVPVGVDAWQITLNWMTFMVVGGGIAIMATYWWINRNVLTDSRFYDPNEQKKDKKKLKMGVWESFGFIARSPYLLALVVLVMGYGISINLIEVSWKKYLGMQYPNPNDYQAFMGGFSRVTGILTIFMMLFVGGNVVRILGWRFAALFTPIILIITGMGFFGFVLGQESLAGYIAELGTTPLFLAVMFGAAQNILSKSTKYSLFDPTKEMAYIPLDPESKVKGKAAVDVVGARLGKSGGSLVLILLFTMIGGITQVTPYIAVILFGIVGAWVLAVFALSKRYNALTAKTEGAAAPVTANAAT